MIVGLERRRRGSRLLAVDAETGRTRWSTVLPYVTGKALQDDRPSLELWGAEGLVVVEGSGAQGVEAFDAHDGRRLWRYVPDGGDPIPRGVAIDGNAVYYGTSASEELARVRRLDRATGTVVWERTMGRALSVAEGRVFSRATCELRVHDAGTGDLLWRQQQRTGCRSSFGSGPPPIAADGVVADTSPEAVTLRAAATGEPLATLPDPPRADPIAVRDGTWLLDGWSELVAVDASGSVRWRVPLRERNGDDRVSVRLDGDAVVAVRERPRGASGRPEVTVSVRRLSDGQPVSEWTMRGAVGGLVSGSGPTVARLGNHVRLTPGPRGVALRRLRTVLADNEGLSDYPDTTRERRVTVPLEIEEGRTARCRLDAGPWEPCGSNWTTPELETEGEHDLWFQADDLPPSRYVLTVDRTPPTVRITRRPTDLVGGPTEGIFDYASDDPLARFECQIDGGPWRACQQGFSTRDERDGTHRFRVRAIDVAGNVSDPDEASWEQDGTSPRITIEPFGDPELGPDLAVRFTIDDERPTDVVRCRLVGPEEQDVVDEDCRSPWIVAVPRSGRYQVELRSWDRAGNEEYGSARLEVRRADDWGFRVTRTLADPGTHHVNLPWQRRVAVAFDVAPPAEPRQAECRFDDAPAWVACEGIAVGRGEQGIADRDGRHEVAVRARDRWARVSPEQRYAFGIDTTPPVLELLGGDPGPVRRGSVVELPQLVVDRGRETEQSPVVERTCEVRSGDVASSAHPWCPQQVVAEGPIVIRAQGTDAAGNEASIERVIPAMDDPRAPDGGDVGTGADETPAAAEDSPARPAGAAEAVLAALLTLRPQVTRPDVGRVPLAPPPAVRTCRAARATGVRRPVIRRVRRVGSSVRIALKVPGVTARTPVRVDVQVRVGCGRWRVARSRLRVTRRTTIIVVPGSRAGDVRVRLRTGARGVSASRSIP
ncbi:PQQ-binding-like beta-propeller repeat protein [Patulibacter brassicae]|uniref:PQQ-binding-like beta-propeller repeat protein n=1 Tax=Patulibacter brassicae TaxID=1705717 RepID=A0ABU4VNK8_9ACTN|nr:PQQ-binding-like beta-propeller repeat protein [Patulibacter brassicae]MDX8152521.1 PQQ-binding-like beta-propeller repeat protein [Patulibacter brassicae]